MTILDTQLLSYEAIQEKLPERRRAVLQAISEQYPKGLSLTGLCQKLHWPINCVSGRVTELRKLGLIEDSGARETNSITKRSSVIWIASIKNSSGA